MQSRGRPVDCPDRRRVTLFDFSKTQRAMKAERMTRRASARSSGATMTTSAMRAGAACIVRIPRRAYPSSFARRMSGRGSMRVVERVAWMRDKHNARRPRSFFAGSKKIRNETRVWTDAQNRATDDYFTKREDLSGLRARIAELLETGFCESPYVLPARQRESVHSTRVEKAPRSNPRS